MYKDQNGEINRNLIIGIVLILVVGVILAFVFRSGDEAEAPEASEPVASRDDAVPPLAPDDEVNTGEDDEELSGPTSSYTVDSFSFGYSIERLEAAPGETVTINLTNSGGSHDFVIDELGVATTIIGTGETDSVTFTIPEDAAGETYEFYCSVGNHRELGMVGELIVSEL